LGRGLAQVRERRRPPPNPPSRPPLSILSGVPLGRREVRAQPRGPRSEAKFSPPILRRSSAVLLVFHPGELVPKHTRLLGAMALPFSNRPQQSTARPPAGAFGRPTPAGVRATSPNPTPRQQTLGGSAVVDQRQPQNGPAILKGNPPQRSDQHPLGPPAERAHV